MEDARPDLLTRLAAGWSGYVLVVLIAVLSALPGLVRMPVMDRDEARFAQATVQMLETGDYVRINVQDVPRNKKPIGIHWLQAASVSVFSDVGDRAIWAFRLPSLLGAALAAFAAFWAGTALFPRRTALIGASLFAAGVLLGFEGMTAKTDAMLCGCITLAMAALARIYAAKRADPDAKTFWLSIAFWAAMGVGVLIKGPVAPLVATLTLIALGVWERRWRWMRALAHPVGPILAAIIVLPWMIAIGIETQGRFFTEALTVDLAPKLTGGSEGHSGPPGYHLAALAFLIFPATLALPAALRLGWRTFRAPRNDDTSAALRFMICWALPTFLFFEILPTKLAHYPLPTYPALALLAAAGFVTATSERWRWTQAIGLATFAIAGAALVALASYASTFMPGDVGADERRALQTALTGGIALTVALTAMIVFRNMALRIGVAIVIALTASFALRERILPEARTLLVTHEITRALGRNNLNPRLNQNAPPLWVVGYGETSLVFETRTDTHISSATNAASHVNPGDTVVVEGRERTALTNALRTRNLSLAPIGAPIRGQNYANGDDVALTINRVTSAGSAAAPPPAP